ncbi:MAG: XrtA system polysaccharide chain length determinant [Pseudomonadota bacterium]
MKQQQEKIEFSRLFDVLRRRKWYVIPAFFLTCIAGLTYCLTTPPVYRASTLIAVDRQKVPESFVSPTVTAGIDERIQSIGEEIMSRTNLERVITRLNLYPEDRRRQLPMELIVEKMRKSIHVDLSKKGTAFTISFEATNPTLVAPVSNLLASMFMEEHLKLREERAKGTTEFLANELQQMESQLKEREAAVSRYKMAHMGQLPTQSQATLAVLERLQQQHEGVQESIRRAQESKILIQQQMQLAGSSNLVQILEDEPAGDSSVEQLKQHLAALETKYKPDHPDVLKAKKMIEKREKQLAEEAAAGGQPKETEKAADGNPMESAFRSQLAGIDMEIRTLKDEAAGLKAKTSSYQGRIENMPRREQEMTDLERDYNNLTDNYQKLLAKKLEAERAENLERKQKGEQFRILDPAREPELPFKPDIPRVLAMAFLGALGASVGLAFGREYIDKSLYHVEDVESLLKLPVLARIPEVTTPDDIKKRRTKRIVAFGAVVLGLATVSILLFGIITKYPGLMISA